VVISALALFLAYRQANVEEMVGAFRGARYSFVIVSFLMMIVLTAVRGLRWSVLTAGRLKPLDAFWLFNIGFLVNNLLPARIGELARASLAGRRPDLHFTSALSSIIVERLFDMVSVVVLFGIVLIGLDLPAWATGAGTLMGAVAVSGITVLAIAARRPDGALRLGTRLLALLPGIDEDRAFGFLKPFVDGLGGVSNLRVFAGGLVLSLLAWLLSGMTGWLLMQAFWPQAPLLHGLLAIAGAGLGISVPAAPSGVGPYHAAVIGLLTAIGYNADLTRSYAFLLHAMNFIVPNLLGIAGLMREGVSFRDVARGARDLEHAEFNATRSAQPDERQDAASA
jgi:hypothetical protein